MTSDDSGSHWGKQDSLPRPPPREPGWTPDWDWTQPLRPTDASLTTRGHSTEAIYTTLTISLTPATRWHSRLEQRRFEAPERKESRQDIFMLVSEMRVYSDQTSGDCGKTNHIFSWLIRLSSECYVLFLFFLFFFNVLLIMSKHCLTCSWFARGVQYFQITAQLCHIIFIRGCKWFSKPQQHLM